MFFYKSYHWMVRLSLIRSVINILIYFCTNHFDISKLILYLLTLLWTRSFISSIKNLFKENFFIGFLCCISREIKSLEYFDGRRSMHASSKSYDKFNFISEKFCQAMKLIESLRVDDEVIIQRSNSEYEFFCFFLKRSSFGLFYSRSKAGIDSGFRFEGQKSNFC